MLVFVTSIRHPRNATDYQQVERLLARTIGSVDGQQDRNFRIVVVGNRPPAFELPDSAEFVEVDFPAPSPIRSARTDREAVLADKGTKLAAGLLAARKHSPDHAIMVDADDFVSNRVSGFVNQHPGAPGWYVDRGYMFSARHGVILAIDRFNERCGTSVILRYDLLGVTDLPVCATQDELVEGFGAFTVRELLGSHRTAVTHFAGLGEPLKPLPFPAAVYVVATGENHSGGTLDQFAKPVGRSVAAEFGITASTGRFATASFVARKAARGRRPSREAVAPGQLATAQEDCLDLAELCPHDRPLTPVLRFRENRGRSPGGPQPLIGGQGNDQRSWPCERGMCFVRARAVQRLAAGGTATGSVTIGGR